MTTDIGVSNDQLYSMLQPDLSHSTNDASHLAPRLRKGIGPLQKGEGPLQNGYSEKITLHKLRTTKSFSHVLSDYIRANHLLNRSYIQDIMKTSKKVVVSGLEGMYMRGNDLEVRFDDGQLSS
jgi:hypothetical protein